MSLNMKAAVLRTLTSNDLMPHQCQVSFSSLLSSGRLHTFISSRLAGRTPGLRVESEAMGRA